jgi:RNA polymerase sigma-70 factor (sigma-E family)
MRAERERQFREYVVGQSAALRRTAYLLCGDWQHAEDLVQDALCRLFVAWNRAQAVDELHLYTRKILIRGFLSERRRKRVPQLPMDQLPELAAPGASGLAGPEDRVDLMAALARLPKGQRAVLVLRYFDDQSIEESARMLGCSTGNVKSQSARGLAALRGLLSAAENKETA